MSTDDNDCDIFDAPPRAPVDPDRNRSLEGTLAALWENRCEGCGRALHPAADSCAGCALDDLRASVAQQERGT